MINGILNVYKEKGFTSHDVVAKLRGILKQKKIGHTGTLDPDAEGVLPVCLGNATKLCDMLADKSKTYETVLQLGVETDTQDMSGTILEEKPVECTMEEIQRVVMEFVGEYAQIPPMYSAKKISGKKLYELAREGKVVERKPSMVQIHSIDILDVDMENARISMRVDCSKGTYIRTLCHDIGQKLGCKGAMQSLLRTRVSNFCLKDSLRLCEIEARKEDKDFMDVIQPPDKVFEEYSAITVLESAERLLYNGNGITKKMIAEITEGKKEQFRVYDSKQQFVAVYYWDEEKKIYKPRKMFL